jgi:hypothetical protein
VLIETGPFFDGMISLEPGRNAQMHGGKEVKVRCDLKGDSSSGQTQYLFTLHHDACFGVEKNDSTVTATIVVQVLKTKG